MKHLFIIILMAATANLYAQHTLTGKVYDEHGQTIPGVNILIKNTSQGTITNLEGEFQIESLDSCSILEVASIGYATQEINVCNNSKAEICLAPATNMLYETVVTGSALGLVRGLSFQRPNRRSKSKLNCYQSTSSSNLTVQSYDQESYASENENTFLLSTTNPLSTFSIDVDKAGYSNVRRFLNQGQKPPADAVRLEEMVNYFNYSYAQPQDDKILNIQTEYHECPWNEQHKLMLVGLQAKEIEDSLLPPSNLVFLIDVSGSMSDHNKLPLVQSSLKMLVEKLRKEDRVSIVVYAGAAGLVLPPTKGSEKEKINQAIDNLQAGGSTAGGQGIQLAYEVARKHFKKDGNNRIILATDGDFNVGMSSDKDMKKLIEKERKSGVFLTCLGFGMGNLKDSKLELLADKGNGNYAYIDNIQEAQKSLIDEFGGSLHTLAKDVKIQVEFNPNHVQAYRLIGYENRMLEAEDFQDDQKDAGEMGSGHSVTALYEIIPQGVKSNHLKKVAPLKYQTTESSNISSSNELATIKFRYKHPKEDHSQEEVFIVEHSPSELPPSEDFQFASSVALFGMILKDSEFVSTGNTQKVIELAKLGKSNDEDGYKAEFIRLVKAY